MLDLGLTRLAALALIEASRGAARLVAGRLRRHRNRGRLLRLREGRAGDRSREPCQNDTSMHDGSPVAGPNAGALAGFQLGNKERPPALPRHATGAKHFATSACNKGTIRQQPRSNRPPAVTSAALIRKGTIPREAS